MKKQILNLGNVLNQVEQTQINGGKPLIDLCYQPEDCPVGFYCYQGACRPHC